MPQEMIVRCAHDKLVSVKELKAHPKNRNKHPDDQIDRLAKILAYQGWRYPVKVSNRSGFITSGHGRLLAAQANGWAKVPVNFQDYDSEEQEYADVQSDNAIASWAELDLSGINSDLGDLGPDFDIDLLGVKDFVLEPAELIPQCDEDAVPEHVEPKTKLGDVYQLGRHRLMCGDSTSIDAVEKLMGGERADMVFTDPPYGMNLDTDYADINKRNTDGLVKGNSYKPVIGDDEDFDPGILLGYFDYCKEMFLWGADYYCQHIPKGGSWFVWDKRNDALKDAIGNDFELCWSKKPHKRLVFRHLWSGFTARERTEKRIHPTQKPVAMLDWFFGLHGDSDGIVVDLFGGSGSTLIGCEKNSRQCRMMELDPAYVDLIVARWEKYTGQKAELLDG